MSRVVLRLFLTVAVLVLGALPLAADELNATSILTSHKAGATPEGLLAVVSDPANTLVLTAADVETLRVAGLPEPVLAAIQQRLAAQPAQAAVVTPVVPDDPRLVEVVKLAKSGISESIIGEQIKQSGAAYKLSMNDLLYLKQNDVQDSIISALMAAKEKPAEVEPAAPKEVVFNDLMLVQSWWRGPRPGRLILEGDKLSWVDGTDPKQSFDMQVSGLEKIWYTCQSSTGDEVCYQINFKVVKGARHSFIDVNRATGSNATVTALMETLRKQFPRAPFGAPAH